jgi:MoaA/NifB/PqqE/SkfB family radical SAM enzyme
MPNPCKHPFFSLAISTTGDLSPCCAFTGHFGHLSEIKSITEHWKKDPQWTELREKELNGIWTLPGCRACHNKKNVTTRKELFENILKSPEQLSYNEPKIKHLDLAFGNICNLTCIMCSGQYSSSWVQHDKEFAVKHPWRNTGKNWTMSYKTIDELVDWLPEVDSIEIKGGEPLLDKKFKYFLQKVNESGKNMDILVVTNFTIFDAEMAELLKSLPNLSLNISIDGVGKIYEWVRGFSFEKLENNIVTHLLDMTRTQRMCIFTFVASVYNVNHIEEFWDWIEQMMIKTQVMIYPSFALIGANPEHISPVLTKDLQGALSGIVRVQEKITQFVGYQEEARHKIINELERLKNFLIEGHGKVSAEIESRHQVWHDHLIKIRGWDIHQFDKSLSQSPIL